jgi:colanic acid biosynthesis glycosyl transferase WcaI
VRILFLNQYFPPDPAPTGALFAEVADALRARGHQVRFIDAGQDYRRGQGRSGRMRREFVALMRMLRLGMTQPRPDVVVSGTSPPCLAFVAKSVSLWHRARSVHWCMDLYPEIAVALGEIKDGPFARVIGKLMGWSYRRTTIVVALDQDMAVRLREHGAHLEVIRPWVMSWHRSDTKPKDGEKTSAWTWLYSGNLGRAHEWQTLLDAQAINEKENRNIALVFQGGGPAWNSARSHAESLGLKLVQWRPYAPENEVRSSLLEAQCLAVTQRVEVKGMLWPSKLALLLSLPRPILFIGPVEGDIGKTLSALPHAGVFAPGDARGVSNWLVRSKEQDSPVNPQDVLDPEAHREACLAQWVELVEQISTQPSKESTHRTGA